MAVAEVHVTALQHSIGHRKSDMNAVTLKQRLVYNCCKCHSSYVMGRSKRTARLAGNISTKGGCIKGGWWGEEEQWSPIPPVDGLNGAADVITEKEGNGRKIRKVWNSLTELHINEEKAIMGH